MKWKKCLRQEEFHLEKHFVLIVYRHKLLDVTDECHVTIDEAVQ